VRRLQVWAERLYYRAHGVSDVREGLYDPPLIGWRPFLESYVTGELGVHVHLWPNREDGPVLNDTPEFCAVYERPRGPFADNQERMPIEVTRRKLIQLAIRPGEWDALIVTFHLADNIIETYPELRQHKMAVLVDIPEFVKYRKLVPLGIVLPTDKRLRLFKDCPDSWIDKPKRGAATTGPVVSVGDDGKVDTAPFAVGLSTAGERIRGRRATLVDAQSPGNIVESSTEIVHDVGDDETGLPRGGFTPSMAEQNYLGPAWASVHRDWSSGLRVYVSNDAVRIALDVSVQKLVQRVQMHVRPVNPSKTVLKTGHRHGY